MGTTEMQSPTTTVEFDRRERTVLEDALRYYLKQHADGDEADFCEMQLNALQKGNPVPVTPGTPDFYPQVFLEFAQALKLEIDDSEESERMFEFFEETFDMIVDDVCAAVQVPDTGAASETTPQ